MMPVWRGAAGRSVWLMGLAAGCGLCVVEWERQHRELQALQTRQIYQEQILRRDESRLRLELQRVLQSVDQ